MIANFFWQGNLTLYEYKCIESFVKHGFDVKVWSYQSLDLPQGATLVDASTIISQEQITLYSQGGTGTPSLAAFSDVFRFTLLSKEEGWWFDTDCFCLKSVEEFKELANNKSVVSGIESESPLHIACGAIYFKNFKVAKLFYKELKARCKQYNNNLPNWGDIGPKLFTKVVLDNNFLTDISPPNAFYAIHYKETDLILKKENCQVAIERTKESFICHLWNEILRKKSIDKNVAPEDDSFLSYLFNQL